MNTEINPRPHVGQVSVDSLMLARRLRAADVGETISYDEMNALIRRDVRGAAEYALKTARKIALRDNQIVFGTVTGVGIKRLSDDEITSEPKRMFQRIRRAANRTVQVVACADPSKVSPDKQREISAALSIAGTIALFASPKSITAAEAMAVASPTPAKLDVGELVKLFSK